MNAKTIVITGASDGIGASAARQLVALGHNVVIVGRSKTKTEKLATELGVPFHLVDYADLSTVVKLADELRKYPQIDVLANNAGASLGERKLTKDGNEQMFQINVLGWFLLTRLLADKLCENGTTVVQTSSIAANLYGKKFDVNDVQNQKAYTPVKAYGESKLCDSLLTRELHRRYGDKGINAVAFEPWIVRSNFGAESIWLFRVAFHTPLKYLFTISTKRSAKRLVRLATATPGKDFVCGETYSYKKRYKLKFRDDDGAVATRLWDICQDLTKDFH